MYLTSFQHFGGAEIQLLKTKGYLEKKDGCTVKLFDMFNDKLNQHDILHIFMMRPECLPVA
jgi:hypothetical protein